MTSVLLLFKESFYGKVNIKYCSLMRHGITPAVYVKSIFSPVPRNENINNAFDHESLTWDC